MKTTWDGQPISQEKPYGATIVVYRHTAGKLEYLIMHRTYAGPDYEGDWAWTPPSGARHPDEEIGACARRELQEETGLELVPVLTDFGTEGWWVFMAEMSPEGKIRLSVEHDQFAWVSPEIAVQKCRPEVVSLPLQKLAPRI